MSNFAIYLAQRLIDIEAIKIDISAPFIWSSGIQSPIYCDNRKILSHPNLRMLIGEDIALTIRMVLDLYEAPQIIAAVATGGISMGTTVADILKLPLIYVRSNKKEHGLLQQVEGSWKKGDKVMVIEDHISTGESSLRAIEALTKEGLDVIGLISITTYGFERTKNLFKENNVVHYSLCDLSTILQVALEVGKINQAEYDMVIEFTEQFD